MRRDVGNEVTVAIAALGVLAFALTFAIILSLTTSNPNNVRETRVLAPSPTSGTITAGPSDTGEPSGTETALSPLRPTPTQWLPSSSRATISAPEITASDTPTRTETPAATATDKATATAMVTNTDTATRTATHTATASATATHTPTA